ncbi:hypothetical protein NFI96_002428, partial [Prochilodus magdalenae]
MELKQQMESLWPPGVEVSFYRYCAEHVAPLLGLVQEVKLYQWNQRIPQNKGPGSMQISRELQGEGSEKEETVYGHGFQ